MLNDMGRKKDRKPEMSPLPARENQTVSEEINADKGVGEMFVLLSLVVVLSDAVF